MTTTASLYLRLTDRHGREVLTNMAMYAIVAANPAGGSWLYPVSLRERYDGPAVPVREGLDAFHRLPGFVPMSVRRDDGTGRVDAMVNMARVTDVRDAGDGRVVSLAGSTSTLATDATLDDIMAAMSREVSPAVVPG